MKTNHSNNRSLKQNSNRLAAYLAAGIGAGIVATPVAEAAIVTIDINSTGFGIDGVNAGLSNDFRDVFNFPISGSGTLIIYSMSSFYYGISSNVGLFIASGNSEASPTNFSQNQSIGSSANWVNAGGGLLLIVCLILGLMNPPISDQEATWDSKQPKGTTAGWR